MSRLDTGLGSRHCESRAGRWRVMTAFPRCPECNGQRVPMNYVGDVVGDVCYCGFARRSQPSTSFEDVYRVQTAEITRLRAEVDRLKLQRTAADIVGRETANIALLQAGEIGVLRDALENVRLLAARHRTEEWAGHMLRFCADVGVKGSPLRKEET